MKKLVIAILALTVMMNCSGCLFLGMSGRKKSYTLEERRTAVTEYLEEKYGEEFIEIAVEPAGILASYDTFHMYPKARTEDDKFIAYCKKTSKGLTISDGYFGVLIRDRYEEVMYEIVGETCDEFFLEVSTEHGATWSGRYNRDTALSELYQKGDVKNYASTVRLHIKESSTIGRSIEEMLQPIAQTMLNQCVFDVIQRLLLAGGIG